MLLQKLPTTALKIAIGIGIINFSVTGDYLINKNSLMPSIAGPGKTPSTQIITINTNNVAYVAKVKNGCKDF